MISSIMKRLHIITAKLMHNTYLKHSLWRDVVHETVKFYGWHKAHIHKKMKISNVDTMLHVTIEDRAIYWPAQADPARLVDMYFEVFNQHNNHYFDIPEMKIKTEDVVIDCGACEGYFTRKALESGAGKVYSIEPGVAAVHCLSKTFAPEISRGTVSIHPCLIGEINGPVDFFDDISDPTMCQTSSSTEWEQRNGAITEVHMVTIDDFCSMHSILKVNFIKADVEGGEVGLIIGAEKTIRKHRPNLAIAVYHGADNANRIVEFIESLSLNYKIRVKGIVEFDGIPRPVMVHCFHS